MACAISKNKIFYWTRKKGGAEESVGLVEVTKVTKCHNEHQVWSFARLSPMVCCVMQLGS